MIFVDTGALVARHVRTDKHHAAAKPVWRSLDKRGVGLVTTNYVLSETVTLLNRLRGPLPSVEMGRRLLGKERITLVHVEQADEFRALELLDALDAIPDLSFADAMSFVVMRRRGIATAFTFDGHFERAGFKTIP